MGTMEKTPQKTTNVSLDVLVIPIAKVKLGAILQTQLRDVLLL